MRGNPVIDFCEKNNINLRVFLIYLCPNLVDIDGMEVSNQVLKFKFEIVFSILILI